MEKSQVDHRQCQKFIKKGFYRRKQDSREVQRFYCCKCRCYFSSQTYKSNFKDQKSRVNTPLLRLLCSGVSQRRCAKVLFINQKTVARKIRKLARACREYNHSFKSTSLPVQSFLFDEMETFEHSKCKPLSIGVSVEYESRRILSMKVASMPAKGLLAKKARKKYGYRKDDRRKAISALLEEIKVSSISRPEIRSDMNPRYDRLVSQVFPKGWYHQYKGRRGCVVGQGELKRGGYDPLFYLNHTCAMIRDNLKRLSRRTWCTTKKKAGLIDLLDIYQYYHNHTLLSKATSYI